jgi:8-oxo-dGTP pyrophosphatase MutT (NUDIX family)
MSDGATRDRRSATPVAPRPAATVALVRDAPGGLEVLLLQRSPNLKFMPGAYVFPGGALDPSDSAPEVQACCAGPGDEEASRTLGVARGGLAYWIAAIREAFEEAGILLAYGAAGGLVDTQGEAAARYLAHRRALGRRHGGFGAILKAERLRLAADRLIYFGHWITPLGVHRRFDTRFFLAVSPERQRARHDERETVAHVWVRPRDALASPERLGLRFPTIRSLEQFSAYATAAELAAAMAGNRRVPTLQPVITRDGRSVLPGEPGYDEAAAS